MVLMGEQVKRGNTFFLNLDGMKENELAVFVPDALNARIREVENLEPKPSLYKVYSTYYGFSILTSGSVTSRVAGVPEGIREELLSVLGDIGGIKKLESKQLKFSSLAFPNCSGHLIALLWNLLKLSIGGKKGRLKALKKLGALGDSRALDLLHHLLEGHVPIEIMECIGQIGHPSSYPHIKEDWWSQDRLIEPLAGLCVWCTL
jgi:hypothetical protein